jgi:hypothetical protein
LANVVFVTGVLLGTGSVMGPMPICPADAGTEMTSATMALVMMREIIASP